MLLFNLVVFEFEVSVCEVICRKDTAKIIELTILPELTKGLKVVMLIPLCIGIYPDDGELICEFDHTANC